MKRLLYVLVFALSILCLTACKKKEGVEQDAQYYTVTFVQDGQDNIVKTVLKGTPLTDIPKPKVVEGYDVTWEDADLSKITQNMTVMAVCTPKQYTITYDLGACKDNRNVQIKVETQSVTYDAGYTLEVPRCEGYTFMGWTLNTEKPITYFTDGIYTSAEDITLIAIWSVSAGDEEPEKVPTLQKPVQQNPAQTDEPSVDEPENPRTQYVTITFAQKGEKNIVKKVEKGGSLTEIPTPKQVEGYEVTWDRTDFTNISKNITVTAVRTPRQYVITYDLGERKNDNSVSIKSPTQKVTYDKAYTLYVPSCKGYTFVGWNLTGSEPGTYFTDGIYKITKNITLTAMWVKVEDHEWTKNY